MHNNTRGPRNMGRRTWAAERGSSDVVRRTRNAGCRTLVVGCWMQAAGLPDSGRGTPVAGLRSPDTGRRTPAAGHPRARSAVEGDTPLPFTLEELSIILGALALALGGLVKGVTGMGLPLVTIPVLAEFLGVERAVLTMLIPSFVLNVYQVWRHRDANAELPELPRFLIAGIPGAVVGATVLYLASERFLTAMLGIWLLSYVLLRLARPELSLTLASRMRWSALVGAGAGALQAATGIAAPIVAPYADSIGLRPNAYVFAVAAAFGAFAGFHLLIVVVSSLYTVELLTQGVLAVLPAAAFIPVGMRVRRFVTRRTFDLLLRLTLAVMSVRLIYVASFGG